MANYKTTKEQIANYWIENSNIEEIHLNFDWAEAYTYCWNCGRNCQSKTHPKKIRLERCHIVPASLGGGDIPSNYVLLCYECHLEAPDCINPKYIWEWIKGNKNLLGVTGTYKAEKALRLFKQRRGYSFFTIKDFIKNDKKGVEQFDNDFKRLSKTNIQTHGNTYGIETYYCLFCELYDLYNVKS